MASVLPGGPSGPPDKAQLGAMMQEMPVEKLPVDKPDLYKVEAKPSHAQVASSGAGNQAEKVKKLPIWLQVAQEKSSVFHDTEYSRVKEPNPDSAVLRIKKNINEVKRNLEKENTAEIEKMIRERVANFRLKFGCLNQNQRSCLFEDQKVKIQDIKDSVNKSKLEDFDIQPSKWYEDLRETTCSLTYCQNKPQITEVLEKLQTFSHMDNKTLPFGKAKLCLLVMSLPAYDICQIYVQRALKFIFEKIMLGQESQFTEWLTHRKIPYMLTSDQELSPSRHGSPFNF